MFKFLRKYNKWILAVGGTLLMIVFLVPQAIETLSRSAAVSGATWGTIGPGGTEVTAQERDQAIAELEVLDRLRRVDPTMMLTDDADHWYLFVQEAEEAGLVGGRPAIPDEQRSIYASIAGTYALDEALAKRGAVNRLLRLYQNAGKISDTRIRRHTQRQFHSVDTRMIVLEATAESDLPDPTEDAILAQFEEFRDVMAGEGEGPGFGYKLPDRLKVEWLRINTEDVRAMVESSGAAGLIQLFKHWKRHELDGAKAFPPVDEGAEIPEVVRTDLINDLTAEKRDEIRKFANDQLLAARRRLSTREDYYVLTDDWSEQRVDFSELARQIQEAFPGLALPSYEAIGDRWLTIADVAAIETLGSARSDKFGPRPVTADTLMAAAKEFGGTPPILIQEGIASPALEDSADQSIVFFRITDTDPSRPPHNVDEVRDQVVTDLRRKADYDRLLARASSLEADARARGLLTVALDEGVDLQPTTAVHLDNANLLAFQLQQNFELTRSSALPVIGQHLPTVEKIIDEALRLTADRDLTEVPREERTFTVPVDDRMALLVVELVLDSPVTREQYTQLIGYGLQDLLRVEELDAIEPAPADVFGRDAMLERHQFEVRRRDDDVAEEAATQPSS